MPLYNVKCMNCDAIQELLVSLKDITDDGRVLQVSCPICDHIHLKKLNSFEGSSAVIHVTGYNAANGYSK
jgi:predicted nucleic acid-binding Zn ribbon protein